MSPENKNSKKFCKHCKITFSHLSSFINHRKLHCPARQDNKCWEHDPSICFEAVLLLFLFLSYQCSCVLILTLVIYCAPFLSFLRRASAWTALAGQRSSCFSTYNHYCDPRRCATSWGVVEFYSIRRQGNFLNNSSFFPTAGIYSVQPSLTSRVWWQTILLTCQWLGLLFFAAQNRCALLDWASFLNKRLVGHHTLLLYWCAAMYLLKLDISFSLVLLWGLSDEISYHVQHWHSANRNGQFDFQPRKALEMG
jgi:hypothetical protein